MNNVTYGADMELASLAAKLKVTCQLTGGTIKYTAGGQQYRGE